MTHCRECNSEIAEAEAFCPFCGISLTPAEVAGESSGDTASEETDIDMSETIVAAPDVDLGDLDDSAVESDEDSGFVDVSELRSESESEESADSEASDSVTAVGEAKESESEISVKEASGNLPEEASAIEADDEEIEEAVSVIDQKAEVWRDSDKTKTKESEELPLEPPVEIETDAEDIVTKTEGYADIAASDDDVEIEINSDPDVEAEIVDGEAAESIVSEPNADIDMEATLIGGPDDFVEPAAKASDDNKDVSSGTAADRKDKTAGEEPAEPEEPLITASSEGDTKKEALDSGSEEEEEEKATSAQLTSDGKPVEFLDADIAEAGAVTQDDSPEEESSGAATGEEKQYTTPNIGNGDTDGSKTPKLRPLDEGTVLNDRYEIVRKIGGGGMGAVYLASDKNLGGVLRAVKEMVQSYIEKEQQDKAIQDFKRESMLLTSLEHSAIPTIYDYFYDEKEARFYLVMKYISGGDLAARLRAAPEGRLDEINVTQWAIEISDVLAYLHDRQPPIVYRDLKPANIMIDGNSSKIMLIDFGIARWVNKEEKGVTAVGTMGYAPPELFSGNVVPSSDIYSLGSTMFHLLTGADPQNNPLLIFDFQKHPRPRQINPNLSDQMERILMRSVEYNAERRFVSAAEMREELQRHLQGLKTGQVSYGIKETPEAVALSDQPVFCGFCGQKIVATDMFCAFCGAKQPLAQPGVQSQEYVIPQTTARLVVQGTGDLNVPTFDLGKKENLVGRRDPMSNIFPEVDLSKYDPQTKISRKHARIWREGETYMLEDLGSSNGTMLIQSSNDTTRLAPHQSRALSHGDKIQVGDTMLHFVLG